MDSTKLRRTFHYPSENSEDDDNPREIDEEGQYIRGHKGGSSVINAVVEQEKYIAKLRRENEEKNDQYEVVSTQILLDLTNSDILSENPFCHPYHLNDDLLACPSYSSSASAEDHKPLLHHFPCRDFIHPAVPTEWKAPIGRLETTYWPF